MTKTWGEQSHLVTQVKIFSGPACPSEFPILITIWDGKESRENRPGRTLWSYLFLNTTLCWALSSDPLSLSIVPFLLYNKCITARLSVLVPLHHSAFLLVPLPCNLLCSGNHYPLEAQLRSQWPSPHPGLEKLSGLTLVQKMKTTPWDRMKLPFNLSRLLSSPFGGESSLPSDRWTRSLPAHEAATLSYFSVSFCPSLFPI